MKKLTLLTIIALLPIPQAQAFTSKEPDYSYNIYSDSLHTGDSSIKIYEFTPKSNLRYTCMVLADDTQPQLECFPKQ